MKFQNPSFNKNWNGQTNAQMEGQAKTNMHPTFQSLGYKKRGDRGYKIHGYDSIMKWYMRLV